MKESLIKFVNSVFSSIEIEDNISFIVYEIGIDRLPDLTIDIQKLSGYLVCCEYLLLSQSLLCKDKLSYFLGKEVYHQVVGEKTYIYWFEGIITSITNNSRNNIARERISFLKTSTVLPNWLDDCIFNQLNGVYAPNHQQFENNLKLSEAENRIYLGTYFPRSYAESFCVFENIFQSQRYIEHIESKKEINILSVGSGTGGDVLGLLSVLSKYGIGNKINIWAIDGNKIALDFLSQIISKYENTTNKKVELNIIHKIIDSFNDLQSRLSEIHTLRFDFILSFKMINEIISHDANLNANAYFDFCKSFLPLLTDAGLCMLLDVTTKCQKENCFFPIIKNRQVNRLIKEMKYYKTLIPLPCSDSETVCLERCFTQQKFHISHKQKKEDVSKVSYRIIGRDSFITSLLHGYDVCKYVLKKRKTECISYCPISNGGRIADGYNLRR